MTLKKLNLLQSSYKEPSKGWSHSWLQVWSMFKGHFRHITAPARESSEEDDFGLPTVEWKMLGTAGACCHIYFLSFGLSKHWCAAGKTPERGHWKWQEPRHRHPALSSTDLILLSLRLSSGGTLNIFQPIRFSHANAGYLRRSMYMPPGTYVTIWIRKCSHCLRSHDKALDSWLYNCSWSGESCSN